LTFRPRAAPLGGEAENDSRVTATTADGAAHSGPVLPEPRAKACFQARQTRPGRFGGRLESGLFAFCRICREGDHATAGGSPAPRDIRLQVSAANAIAKP